MFPVSNVLNRVHFQVVDGKSGDVDEKDKDGANGKPRLQKPMETVTLLKKEASLVALGERKPSKENGLKPPTVDDVAEVAKPATEKKAVATGMTVMANGVANGC